MAGPERAAPPEREQPEEELRRRLEVAEHTLSAIRRGEVDAIVVQSTAGDRLFTLQGADHFYRVLFEEMPAGAAALDANGLVVFANGRLARMVGRPLQQVVGAPIADALAPEAARALRRALEAGVEGPVADVDRLVAGGEPVALSLRLLVDDDEARCCLVATDLSPLVRADRARSDAQERFERAFQDAPIGMAMLDLDGELVDVNAAMSTITGRPAATMSGRPLARAVDADDAAAMHAGLATAVANGAGVVWEELHCRHVSGRSMWLDVRATVVRGSQGEAVRVLAQVQDVSERREHADRLEHLADHDPLTGLLNRRAFGRVVDAHAAQSERFGPQGALLVLDLDHFKYINDTRGHLVGDDLILRTGRTLRERLRESDALARLGGDEFAVLLPREDAKGAGIVAEALLSCLATVQVDGVDRREVTASIGVAMFGPGATGASVLVDADLAMYDAKEGGRGRVVFHTGDEGPVRGMRRRVAWADRVEHALRHDRFTLLAQPIVDLADRRVIQHEVLLRMVDEDGTLVPPGEFLPVAEQLGAIRRIDSWVISRALDLLADLPRAVTGTALEVNLSGRSIGDPGLLAHIDAELERTGVDPARLILEITETAAVEDFTEARRFARQLTDRGCRFALDDFGSGFSSFAYLKQLPCDFIKVDGSFVQACTRSETDRVIIRAVVDIAHGLGKRTIAEFVEDEATAELLTELGVDQGQGYHFGRPAPLGPGE